MLTGTGGYAYVTLDTFTAIGVPGDKKVISVNVKGWDAATSVFNVVKTTDGLSAVLISAPGTFGRVTVEVAYQ